MRKNCCGGSLNEIWFHLFTSFRFAFKTVCADKSENIVGRTGFLMLANATPDNGLHLVPVHPCVMMTLEFDFATSKGLQLYAALEQY